MSVANTVSTFESLCIRILVLPPFPFDSAFSVWVAGLLGLRCVFRAADDLTYMRHLNINVMMN